MTTKDKSPASRTAPLGTGLPLGAGDLLAYAKAVLRRMTERPKCQVRMSAWQRGFTRREWDDVEPPRLP